LTCQHRVAQRAAHPLQDGGLQQELANERRLALEYLVGQIVEHKMMPSRKAIDEPGGVLRAAFCRFKCQGGHLQARDPPLGAFFQGSDFGDCEIQPHSLVEERGCLCGRESQIVLADLGQLPAGAQARKGKGRVLAGSDGQVQAGWQVIEQKGEGLMDGLRLDQVIVVEDEDKAVSRARRRGRRKSVELVDQGREYFFHRWPLLRSKRVLDAFAYVLIDRLQRSDQWWKRYSPP